MNPATLNPARVAARAVAARLFRSARESAVARGEGSATGTSLAAMVLGLAFAATRRRRST